MKTKSLLNFSLFLLTIGLFAQTPDWTLYKQGITKEYFRDSSWNYTNNKRPFEYGVFPFVIKETHSKYQNNFSNVITSKDGGLYIANFRNGISKFDGTNWIHYNTENSNISSNNIITFLEDKNGIIWIATDKGLNKFDGTNWITYNTTNSNISSNNIFCLLEDKDGIIWVGTDKGLNKFDGTNWEILFGTSQEITTILEDANGMIWLSIQSNLYKFDGKKITEIPFYNYYTKKYDYTEYKKPTVLFEDKNGTIWFGTQTSLYKFDGTGWIIMLSPNYIKHIIQTQNGDLYINSNDGISKFNGKNWFSYISPEYEHFSSIFNNQNGELCVGTLNGIVKFDDIAWIVTKHISETPITDMIKTQKGTIWVGLSDNNHIAEYNQQKWKIHTPLSIYDDKANSILETKNGNIIVGTNYSDKSYNISNFPQWKNITVFNQKEIKISTTALLEDKNGNIWAGTNSEGISTKKDGIWLTYNTENSKLSNNKISSLLEDKNGNIWIGTNNGLNKFDSINWIVYNTINSEVANDKISSLLEDKNGNIWIGTDNGLNKFDGTNWVTYNTINSNITDNAISTIFEASNGDIYIGTNSSGAINKFDGTTWTNYNPSLYESEYKSVKKFIQNDNGTIWVGTTKNIYEINQQDWMSFVVKINKKDSVKNRHPYSIYNIFEDNNGKNYAYLNYYTVSLTKNIATFNDTTWTHYTSKNSNFPIFNYNCHFVGKNGDIYFGTYNGLSKFDGTNWITYNTTNSGIAGDFIHSILEVQNGDIFIGTNNGLSKFDGTNWITYNTTNSGIASNFICSLLETNNGEIFIGTNNGLSKFDGNTNWVTYNTTNSEVASNSVCSLLETNGQIFIGTNNGLSKFDGTNWITYNTTNSGLSDDNITYLLKNKKGEIYVIANSKLDKFNGQKWENNILHIIEQTNPNLQINSLIEEESGKIYIATNQGLLIGFNNSTFSKSFFKISGQVFLDKNDNTTFDNGEYLLKNQKVKLLPNNITTYTNDEGKFSFKVDSGNYTIEYISSPNWKITTSPTSYNISIDSTSIDSLLFGVKGIQDTTNLSTSLTTLRTRCGFTIPAYIDYNNLGTTVENAIISLELNENIKLKNSFPSTDSTNNHKLYWHQNNFSISQHKQIQLQLELPGVDFIGDTLISIATISTKEGYTFTDTLKSILTCAYDPNDKLVKPAGILKEHYTLIGSPLDYTIRFQNTGTDTAFNVVILDTISPNLDLNTFQLKGASHPIKVNVINNNVYRFEFDNILLPDSNVNEPKSHGYVKFSIQPKNGLAENTKVENTGYIYFDFNPAIITNTAFNTYVSKLPRISGVNEIQDLESQALIIPNPLTNEAVIQFKNDDNSNFTLQVFDLTGNLVQKIEGITTSKFTFYRNSLSSGLYFYQLSDGQKTYNGKMMIQE